jgi:hypothetical protein
MQNSDYRNQVKAKQIPRFYNGFMHLFFNLSIVVVVNYFLYKQLSNEISALAWMMIPVGILMANMLEYALHRFPMHNQNRYMKEMFKRHTPLHHRYFDFHHMDMTDSNDLYFILLPFKLALRPAIAMIPLFFGMKFLFGADIAAMFLISFLTYFISEEWIHLSTHTPAKYYEWCPPLAVFIKWLKRHHQLHHDFKLMREWNFNISLPISDHLFGTYYKEETEKQVNEAVRLNS